MELHPIRKSKAAFIAALMGSLWLYGHGSLATNLLANGEFEIPGPLGDTSTYTGVQFAGPSAAEQWTMYNNTYGTTDTNLLGSTLPGSGPMMIHVITSDRSNGLVQYFLPEHTGPNRVLASIWVYVVSGIVAMGTGDGSPTGWDALSTTTNTWEHLEAPNGLLPANEFILYSAFGPAEFYADNAEVVVPYVPGDVDGNGVVELSDAVRALRMLNSLDPVTDDTLGRADVSPWQGVGGREHGDGVLSLADAAVILRIAAGLPL